MSQRKSTPQKPEKPQGQRFIDFAKQHGAENPQALERAMGNLAKAKPKDAGDSKK
jgi:hypothetical protein